jgi:hypothetical protein
VADSPRSLHQKWNIILDPLNINWWRSVVYIFS